MEGPGLVPPDLLTSPIESSSQSSSTPASLLPVGMGRSVSLRENTASARIARLKSLGSAGSANQAYSWRISSHG